MRATCIDNFAQPALELNKEYEVEKLEGESVVLKDLPFQWPVRLFKIEGSLFEWDKIATMKVQYNSLTMEIDNIQMEIDDLEGEIREKEREKEILEKNIKALGGKL